MIEAAAKPQKTIPAPQTESKSEVIIKEEPVDAEEEPQVEGNEFDGNGDEDSAHHADEDGHEIDQVGDVDDVCVILDDEEDEANAYDQSKNGTEEANEGEPAEGGEGEPAGDEEMQEENTGDTVNMDNDESINLTIGEEEQKLLHDEVIYINILLLVAFWMNFIISGPWR